MKHAVLFIAVSLIGLTLAPGAVAQTFTVPNVTGTSMADIYTAGAVLVSALESNEKEIVHIEYDIVYQGVTTTNYRMLSNRWSYTFLGFADFRITDLDLKVSLLIDTVWVPVGQDQLNDKLPTVTVTPDAPGLYRFEMTAYSFTYPYTSGHYGLMIYHVHPDAQTTTPATDQSLH
ncbi:MAG: hypothetical protein WCT27_04510 [Patescibacteria group bacterium]|jgi:hypothetical protein